jgi:hypothetical protein
MSTTVLRHALLYTGFGNDESLVRVVDDSYSELGVDRCLVPRSRFGEHRLGGRL